MRTETREWAIYAVRKDLAQVYVSGVDAQAREIAVERLAVYCIGAVCGVLLIHAWMFA
jgi:hypothetical protein